MCSLFCRGGEEEEEEEEEGGRGGEGRGGEGRGGVCPLNNLWCITYRINIASTARKFFFFNWTTSCLISKIYDK